MYRFTTNCLLVFLVIVQDYVSGVWWMTEDSSHAGVYTRTAHDVQTEDGYILKMFRYSHKDCPRITRGPPVILMHGLLLNSEVWFEAGPRHSLGGVLASECFDVWVGNQRGNSYSRRHAHMTPQDKKFWDFTVDEIGKYDIPAFIDYVIGQTSSGQVNYVGFSQGCGTFYIMCSERPQYCQDKVKLKISLAPATRQLNTRSVGFRLVVSLFADSNTRKKIPEAFPKGGNTHFVVNYLLCPLIPLCESVVSLVDLPHPNSVSDQTLRELVKNFPSGTSSKNMARYHQAMSQRDFVKFDHGPKVNQLKYNTTYPPAHDLSKVTTPVVVIYGANDGVVDIKDVQWLLTKLPNVVESYLVPDPLWNHIDQTDSQYASKLTFPKIIGHLERNSYVLRE